MTEEVLSQSQIDKLLEALSIGEIPAEEIKVKQDEKSVKVYDFKRALRFSKDQIRSLTRIYDQFARNLTTFFSAHLRTYAQVTVASSDQLPYEEYIRSISRRTFLNVVELPPLEGRKIIEVHPNIAYAMLDRLLGGRGSGIDKIDLLTDIEMKLITKLMEQMLGPLQEAWAEISNIEPKLSEIEVNPQFLQVVSPTETVVIVSLQTRIGETSGMINICIPHVVLEPIIPKLSAHYWMESGSRERKPEAIASLEGKIKQTNVEITAELASTQLSIGEFLSLKNNDVIQLHSRIDNPLTIKVGGVPKFLGQPGKKNNKIAVQVLSKIEEGDEDNEW